MQHILSEIFYHAVSVFLACFRVTCSRPKGGENFWGQKSIPAIPVLPARSKSIPVLPIPALPERAQDTMGVGGMKKEQEHQRERNVVRKE